ncbi:DUF6782 family putative metallopeptidase [Thalassovita sp.]|uniref:DUF6782 family putative metallopeptidase n=1 Tax=Thalassovita sp. TaxID=1979401 RepID=UPI0029DE67B6|nr:DUF6782 family putative metallopeptidase [Thalassovita sp.]
MRALPPILLILTLLAAPVAAQPGITRPQDCLTADQAGADSAAQARLRGVLARLGGVLAALPSLGRTLARAAPAICLSDQLHGEHGYMESDGARIVLNAELGDPMLMAVILHELRHLDQLDAGVCPSPALSMSETARSVFAIEADATAVMLLGAWWMRQNGAPEVWDAAARWPSIADIAARFEQAMTAGAQTHQAVSAAFDQWYASDWRRERYYLAACSDYLDQLDRTKHLPRYQLVPDDYFQHLCHLPDGTPYACAEPLAD